MSIDLILGTAGHIDHGKTALIKALTGTDTDRLPEEKKRGITIELGFARLELGEVRLGIVDVPGHERLVRNMLAGATGMDVALLIVAATDSVKPQTQEHLAILRLLDIEAGVIALTKCDLAEPEWIELVETEVREKVSGTFLADAPIVHTSAVTREGLDLLREALAEASAKAAPRAQRRLGQGPFRMAIDRCFTIEGHGTIVTGSVASGSLHVGDELVIQPGGQKARVRSLQNHDTTVVEVHRGQRAAVNLAGISRDQVLRGHELASPGHLVPSRWITVRLRLLESAPSVLKHRARVRVHLGTAELAGRVLLLSSDEKRQTAIKPGEEAIAQLILEAPAVATWNQPFVLRGLSPVATIGGGVVLDPTAARLGRRNESSLQFVQKLDSDEPIERASAALYLAGWNHWQPEDLARSAGIDQPGAVAEALKERGDLRTLEISPTRSVQIHRARFEELAAQVTKRMTKMHDDSPRTRYVPLAPLQASFSYLESPAILEFVLAEISARDEIKRSERGIALAGRGPQLSKREQRLLEDILARYRESGVSAPMVDEIQSQAPHLREAVPSLIQLAAAEGELVEITDQYYLHVDVEASVQETLRENLKNTGLTLSQIRELLGTTRKFAVPLCEFYDRIGFTRRDGDLRHLAEPDNRPS